MFANPIREKDAPNYSTIVLQPVDIASIKKAISHGNKIAIQAAAALPDGDPGTASVDLPISEDLVPPRGIINSEQLERSLVHMFCNAVMYNPDPDRGPGPAFLAGANHGGNGSENIGYQVDEFGVVNDTRNMFLEVDKLMAELRGAEMQRNGGSLQPPPVPTASSVSSGAATARAMSLATAGGGDDTDELDELAADEVASTSTRRSRRG
ncbi:Bromodomain protein [Ceratocystis platani]|uniref:Bromodomain protein n=2 Tax=Ceratocystis TaxID=5157 RepID=A0A0F8BPX5_CERFI|nr:Bromodomain protein [Ceratocystis platani]